MTFGEMLTARDQAMEALEEHKRQTGGYFIGDRSAWYACVEIERRLAQSILKAGKRALIVKDRVFIAYDGGPKQWTQVFYGVARADNEVPETPGREE